MIKIGFCKKWIKLIMMSTMSYSILLNGEQGTLFSPSIGIKQRDPLSPYLFLLCVEGFSSLLREAKKEGLIRGARVGTSNLTLTHLFFAGDNILFGDAILEGVRQIKAIVNEYEKISRQLVNFDKSLIYFNSNTLDVEKEMISEVMGVRAFNNPKKHLGLPTVVGRRKKDAFIELKERFVKRMKSWRARQLSVGGRRYFIKSILQAISIYTMQCFLLPNSLCHEFNNLIVKFLRRNSNTKKGIHWCQW